MYNFLRDHAAKNVWCTPDQDKQAIIKGARLTPANGSWNTVRVHRKEYKLPVDIVRFHVFQVGQLHPMIMGLLDVKNAWEKFSECCIRNKMVIDIYSDQGVQYPRTECWYRVTEDRNLIFAIKEQPLFPIDFNSHNVYLHVYTNAWFSSTDSLPLDDIVDVQGGTMATTQAIMDLQNKFQIAQAKTNGHAYAFVNGLRCHAINLLTTHVGDVAEFVYDSSIYKVVEMQIATLPNFVSELDSKHKYLVHYNGADRGMIEYLDDLDFFLLKKGDGEFSGVYYHKNQPDAVRMVTHRDYSLPVPYVLGFTSHRPDWTDANQIYVSIHLRKSGYIRALTDENNRIQELYKLTDAEILAAMVGTNAVVENWTASNLEKSAYTEIMRSKLIDITLQKTEDAYGYNAMSKLLGNTPSFTTSFSGKKVVDVPYGLTDHSTAYEYDSNGFLLGFHYHTHGYRYAAASNSAALIEMISGIGTPHLDDTFGANTQTLDPNYDYRMYTCDIINGEPNNNWVDVTDSGNYTVINNQLTWLINTTQKYTCVRSNKTFLGYSLETRMLDGLIRFSFDQDMYRNGLLSTWVMQIPMGELDIMLNGKSLIEGLDYFVNFPEVVVVSKNHLAQPAQSALQKLTIRFTGFCKADMSREIPKERGYLDHLLMSNNNRFDIRDDKVMRMIVNGALYHRTELKFAEEDSGVSILDARNGDPYLIRDIVVPLRSNAVHKTYPLRELSKIIDKRISDYMTMKIPAPTFPGPNIIPERYPVFSPFFCKILTDMVAGDFTPAILRLEYNDNDVLTACLPYEYLLKSDPTQPGLEPDDRYVIVHPHNLNTVIGVDIFQWKFLIRVVRLYLKDKVTLAHFVSINTP